MKIVFVNRFFYPDLSATSQLLSDLVFHLSKSGYDIHVVTSRQVYDDPGSMLPSRDSIQGVQVIRVRTTHFGRRRLLGRLFDYMTFYTGAAWRLSAMLRSGDVVVAKTDPPLISVVATLASRMRKAKLVNWLQDVFPEVATALQVRGLSIVGKALQAIRNYSLRTATHNVVLGDRMADVLIDQGVPQDRIRIIHNWADGNSIRPVTREHNRLRREWGLEDKFVVGYSGNLGLAHEFETIIDAAGKLKETKQITFLFIGAGAQRDRVEAMGRERGLKNFQFRPYQPRELLMLSLSVPDVHLISLKPALEGLIVPSKFYGIAAAGRPTIYIGDLDGEIPRVLKEWDSGYAVRIGEATQLADLIAQMAGNDETAQMGMRARRSFDEHYDQRHALAAWEQLFAQAVALPTMRTFMPPQ